MLKALEDFDLKRITWMANYMYNSREFPEQMMKSVFLAIPKLPAHWSVASTEQSVLGVKSLK